MQSNGGWERSCRGTAGCCSLAARWALALAAVACSRQGAPPAPLPPSDPLAELRFVEAAAAAGLDGRGPTFGAALGDLDEDGDEDLVVSRHGYGPVLYLNEPGSDGEPRFVEAEGLLPRSRGDRHGILVLDLDGDGDRDLVMACGGGEGRGSGCPNRLFVNRLRESGSLGFEDRSEGSGLDLPSERRSRAFLPLVSPVAGAGVDLYLTAKPRPGFDNLLLRQAGAPLVYRPVTGVGIDAGFDTEGNDLVLDVDLDGDQDLILLEWGRMRLFEQRDGRFVPLEGGLEEARGVVAAAAGDLDGDGAPDLFLGTAAAQRPSDRLAWDRGRLHFIVGAQSGEEGEDPGESVVIRSAAETVGIDLTTKMGILRETSSALFVGARAESAPARTTVRRQDAAGEPRPADRPGTYLWWESGSDRWHLEWRYGEQQTEMLGSLELEVILDVEESGLERDQGERVQDRVWLNRLSEEGRFVPADDPLPEHPGATAALQLADFDCDGRLDVAGLQFAGGNGFGGELMLMQGLGGGRFQVSDGGLERRRRSPYRPDRLVVGFVDRDRLPDLVATYGGGLRPGSEGPFELYLNRTSDAGLCLLLELRGRPPNRDAVGAQVELRDGSGRLLGRREVGAGIHRSQSSLRLHFGLGRDSGEQLSALVRWADGSLSEHLLDRGESLSVIEQPTH